MTGVCIKCACTDETPCWHPDGPRPCGWIDDERDVCSRCASELLAGPIQPADLAEAALHLRVLRASLLLSAEHIVRLEYLLGAAEPAPQEESGIWTPS
jgi:hypothetical protein